MCLVGVVVRRYIYIDFLILLIPTLVSAHFCRGIPNVFRSLVYENAVQDYYQHPCCSCGIFFKRKSVSIVRFPNNLGTKCGLR